MLISPAYAQGIGGGGGFSLVGLLPLVLIFVVFYFLLIRPQQTKARAHRDMVGAVRRGDSVVTGGGIIGKVTKVIDGDRLQVEIADGVRVVVAKGTISDVVSRGQPVKEPPTRRAGKKKPAARRAEPETEDEEDLEGEEDASFDDEAGADDEAEAETNDEYEEEPEEVEERPRARKRGKKKAAS